MLLWPGLATAAQHHHPKKTHHRTVPHQASDATRGVAAVYSGRLVGHRTANGELLDREHLTTAHRKLPFGTRLEVTNRNNGRKAVVTVNDRGPYRRNFALDLSPAAAAALGIGRNATAPIEYRVAAKH
jgi:rare lipoprotein A